MDNLLDSWERAKRAPEPVEVARKSAGELTVDMLTGREEFRESARRIEEGDVASGVGLGALTAASFVLPWGRGGRLAMTGATVVGGGRAARGAALRGARGLGDDVVDGLVEGATGRPLPTARPVEGLPDVPLSAEIPEGNVRLFHQSAAPAEDLLRDGISLGRARGLEGPRGVYAVEPEAGRGFYGLPESFDGVTVEFSVPRAEWDAASGVLGRSVRPDEIVAVHEPWHFRARYMLEQPEVLSDIRSGALVRQDFVDMGDDFARAYDFVSRNIPDDAPLPEGAIPVGRWTENPTAEEMPLSFLRPFREFDRSTRQVGTDIQDLARQIRERGFDEPVVLDVDPQGWAMISDGNHRLAAAELLGLETVPVRVATRRSGKLVGGAGARLSVVDGLGEGKLFKPSQVLPGAEPGLSVADGPALPPPLAGVRDAVPKEEIAAMRQSIVDWQNEARRNVVNDPDFVDALAERMLSDFDVAEMASLYAREAARRESTLLARLPANLRTQGREILQGVPQSRLEEAGLIPSRFLNPGDEQFVYALRWARAPQKRKKDALRDFARSIQRLRLNQSFGLDDTVRGGAPWYFERALLMRAISGAILDDSGRIAYDPVLISGTMAGFSAGAPPILEPVRALPALPFVREVDGRAIFDLEAFHNAYPSLAPRGGNGQVLEGYNTWGAQVAAALIGDLNLTGRHIISLSDKTFPYAVASIDPTNPFALVLDRNSVYQAAGHNVFGKFISASGREIKMVNPFGQANPTQQMLGFHALMHAVSRGVDGIPMGGQERGWFGTRILLQPEIGESFWLPPGVRGPRSQMLKAQPEMANVFDPSSAQSWEEIATVAFDSLGSAFGPDNVRRLRRLAADNREKFIERVRRGEFEDWEMLNGQPVVRRDKWERVLPPKRRVMPKILQEAEETGLTVAELAAQRGPSAETAFLPTARAIIANARGPFGDWLRNQFAANSQRTLKTLSMLMPWTVVGGTLGAFFGATQTPAEASEGESATLAAGMGFLPAASTGAGLGAAAGLTAGLTLRGVGALVRNTIKPATKGSLEPFHIGVTPDGVETPPIATHLYDDAQKAAYRANNNAIVKFDFEEMSGLKDIVAQDVLDTNVRMSARNLPMQNYVEENAFASLVSENIIEPSSNPLGVNNLYEAVVYWNNVGNKNIQSVLRTGDLSSDESFVRALRTWQANDSVTGLPLSNMSEGEVLRYFEEVTDNSIRLIREAMKNSKHPEFVGYRGVNNLPMRDFLGEDFVRALQSDKSSVIGAEITDPGFLAVSLDASDAAGFAHHQGNYGYVWQFKVPENFDALPISSNWERPGVGLPWPGEREVLLPPNVTLEIVDVQTPADVFAAFNPNGVSVDNFGQAVEIRYDDVSGFFRTWMPNYGFNHTWDQTFERVPNGLITFQIKGTQ